MCGFHRPRQHHGTTRLYDIIAIAGAVVAGFGFALNWWVG